MNEFGQWQLNGNRHQSSRNYMMKHEIESMENYWFVDEPTYTGIFIRCKSQLLLSFCRRQTPPIYYDIFPYSRIGDTQKRNLQFTGLSWRTRWSN